MQAFFWDFTLTSVLQCGITAQIPSIDIGTILNQKFYQLIVAVFGGYAKRINYFTLLAKTIEFEFEIDTNQYVTL